MSTTVASDRLIRTVDPSSGEPLAAYEPDSPGALERKLAARPPRSRAGARAASRRLGGFGRLQASKLLRRGGLGARRAHQRPSRGGAAGVANGHPDHDQWVGDQSLERGRPSRREWVFAPGAALLDDSLYNPAGHVLIQSGADGSSIVVGTGYPVTFASPIASVTGTGGFFGTFSGAGLGLSNLNGSTLVAGTVNSNAFDAATKVAVGGPVAWLRLAGPVLTNAGAFDAPARRRRRRATPPMPWGRWRRSNR